jgi:hypothetical protein
MPAWYVHMEAAHQTARRLQAGDVPAGFPISADEARDLGEVCHTWRNYLALGAIGPDLFYMLPDYSNTKGCVIRQVVQWSMDVWATIDSDFISKWEKWISPMSTNNSQLASQLTGGLSVQFAQILDELTSAVTSAFEGLLATMGDWFGVLTSGLPQGYGNDLYYWADTFHYRRTYQFPFVLFQQAKAARDSAATDEARLDAEARMAFAVGWLSHCATDVTGHPFTNAKSGGPYRDHWQRHHLVELHMDSHNYAAINTGECYGEFGTSALHFRVAFRSRADGPYAGRDDGPAYDYFSGFPAYDTADGPTLAAERTTLFDLDTGELPGHLVESLLDAMAEVHPDGPRILSQDPTYSATNGAGQADGRPNADAMAQMWGIVYGYLKMSSRDGLSPRLPSPPDVFTDHSFPTPPGGGGSGIDDDPSRGADVDDDSSFSLLDLLLALFAWAAYLAQVVVWLLTVLPGLILDPFTFPAREAIYWGFVVPAWNLYILARRALVMSGFLTPKTEEIDFGLTTMGSASGQSGIASALDSPLGDGASPFVPTEPSGRATHTSTFGLDPAYPRNIVRDLPANISRVDLVGALGLTGTLHFAGDADEWKPSEWIAPWRYPLRNQAGAGIPREGAGTHSGPWVAGQTATVLLSAVVGDADARKALEASGSAQETFDALTGLLGQDKHLGAPIDYSLYLVGRMSAEHANSDFGVPDFNLDSDRGYAWHVWDWDRHAERQWICTPDQLPSPVTDFSYAQPCTPPQFFHAATDNPHRVDGAGTPLESQWFDPHRDLQTHYLSRATIPAPDPIGPDPCKPQDRTELYAPTEWQRGPFGGQR